MDPDPWIRTFLLILIQEAKMLDLDPKHWLTVP